MSAQKQATFKIWRGNATGGAFRDYTTGVSEGMVVLDAVNHIQATQANDLAYRWNCKAGKCGSCSAEVNGMPKLMCMTRLSDLPLEKPVTVQPMKAFPLIKDLLTNVSWNFRVKKKIKKFKPPLWRCIHLIRRIALRNCGMLTGSVTAISPSVARRFVPKAFKSRTTE